VTPDIHASLDHLSDEVSCLVEHAHTNQAMEEGVRWEAWGYVWGKGNGNGTEVLDIFNARKRGRGVEETSVSHRVNNGVGIGEVSLAEEDADGVRGFAAELGRSEDGLFMSCHGDNRRGIYRSRLFREERGYDLGRWGQGCLCGRERSPHWPSKKWPPARPWSSDVTQSSPSQISPGALHMLLHYYQQVRKSH